MRVGRPGNRADPFAVAIRRSGVIVGHIPRNISSGYSIFVEKWSNEDRNDRREEIFSRLTSRWP